MPDEEEVARGSGARKLDLSHAEQEREQARILHAAEFAAGRLMGRERRDLIAGEKRRIDAEIDRLVDNLYVSELRLKEARGTDEEKAHERTVEDFKRLLTAHVLLREIVDEAR